MGFLIGSWLVLIVFLYGEVENYYDHIKELVNIKQGAITTCKNDTCVTDHFEWYFDLKRNCYKYLRMNIVKLECSLIKEE
jgi:hypothetical protein